MCPGGYVVNASSEEEHLAINGMSNHERESENANSAIVVTVSSDDFGTSPMSGIEFQRNLESKTYEVGNGNIPIHVNILKKIYSYSKIKYLMLYKYIFLYLQIFTTDFDDYFLDDLSWDDIRSSKGFMLLQNTTSPYIKHYIKIAIDGNELSNNNFYFKL